MSNQAAYLMAAHDQHFEVKDAPIPTPEPNEVVIRNHATSINPVDWKIQDYGFLVPSYPFILGCDGAGIVHAVGSDVTRFEPGDRVITHFNGLGLGKIQNSGFQLYPKTDQALVAKLPDNISFTSGVVLPVALSTAAACLFQKDHLGLSMENLGKGAEVKSTGEVLLIWGGSSSVGSCAIQLATAAGIEVAVTASRRNFDYVKELGAKYAFDHSSPTVLDDIVGMLSASGKKFVGVLDTITTADTVVKSGEIAGRMEGRKFVMAMQPLPAAVPEGVQTSSVFALSVAGNEVGQKIWGEYVTKALADGSFKAKPDAVLVGRGLEILQEGLNRQKAGVSAQKLVVDLDV